MVCNFVGYGKLILNTSEDYGLPVMHFLLAKDELGIQALGLELGIGAHGKDAKEAISVLAEMSAKMIKTNIEASGFNSIIEIFSSSGAEEYWAEYRKIDVTLAKTRSDISRGMIDMITETVRKDLMREYGMTVQTSVAFAEAA